jgi:hypothetical protein
VAAVDYTTGLSDLRLWELPKTPNEITNEDVLLGVGPGYQSESWRVYLDTSKIPHILEVDGRLHIYGSAADHYKIFEGTDISVNGKLISAYYDQNGNLLGENIPMELVAIAGVDNTAIKAPAIGYTNLKYQDGEVVTLVVYAKGGAVLSKVKLLVDNTALVRRTEASRKYVTGIEVVSPWLSEADPSTILFPINTTLQTVSMQGKVSYSDGTSNLLPIGLNDSSKFAMYGLQYWVPGIVGARQSLTLNYKLSEDEYAYIQGPTTTGSITERYWAQSEKARNAYSVKLYMFPVWSGEVNGYTLDFWLYNLDRKEFYRVPKGKIELDINAQNFDGLDFLTVQHITVAVNLKDLDGKFNNHRHTQQFEVSLKAAGTERRTNWTIRFASGQPEVYGTNLEAAIKFVDTNKYTVRISNGFNSKEQWLRELFYKTQPLYDTQTESEAPAPTHFALVTSRRRVEFAVDLWNTDLAFYNDLNEGEVLYLEWFYRNSTTDLQLGVSGLPAHQTN